MRNSLIQSMRIPLRGSGYALETKTDKSLITDSLLNSGSHDLVTGIGRVNSQGRRLIGTHPGEIADVRIRSSWSTESCEDINQGDVEAANIAGNMLIDQLGV